MRDLILDLYYALIISVSKYWSESTGLNMGLIIAAFAAFVDEIKSLYKSLQYYLSISFNSILFDLSFRNYSGVADPTARCITTDGCVCRCASDRPLIYDSN